MPPHKTPFTKNTHQRFYQKTARQSLFVTEKPVFNIIFDNYTSNLHIKN